MIFSFQSFKQDNIYSFDIFGECRSLTKFSYMLNGQIL